MSANKYSEQVPDVDGADIENDPLLEPEYVVFPRAAPFGAMAHSDPNGIVLPE